MKYHTMKILTLIIAAGLIFSITMSATTHAEEIKKTKDTKKDYKKETKKITKKDIESLRIPQNQTTAQAATVRILSPVDLMQKKLEACKTKETQREQYECEKALKSTDVDAEFKAKATATKIGPIVFYYAGAKVEHSGGKDIVNLKLLVENKDSKDNVSLFCTGPAACNYDVFDGTTTYKYASQDFTNGQIVLMPGKSRMFNMLFGPAIGYGSYVDFKFEPSKQYKFNIKEPWGSGSIPLNLK